MDIKINNLMKTSGFNGPSQSYYETNLRFQSILDSKLNISVAKNNTQKNNTHKIDGSRSNIDRIYKNIIADNGVIALSNVREKSKVTAEYIDSKLKGTALEGLGSAFKKAENENGINALFLLGLAIHESDFGKSKIAKEKNNLFGFKAYDSSPFDSAAKFNTKEESINTVARYLSENYLEPRGKYFNGYSIDAIGKRYATDPNWSKGIENRIKSLMGK